MLYFELMLRLFKVIPATTSDSLLDFEEEINLHGLFLSKLQINHTKNG